MGWQFITHREIFSLTILRFDDKQEKLITNGSPSKPCFIMKSQVMDDYEGEEQLWNRERIEGRIAENFDLTLFIKELNLKLKILPKRKGDLISVQWKIFKGDPFGDYIGEG